MKNIAHFVLFTIMLIQFLAGCGSGGGSTTSTSHTNSSSTSDNEDYIPNLQHSIPSWMIGTWKVIRIRLDEDVSQMGFTITFTESGVEYHYEDCDVNAVLNMDPSIANWAGNEYIMEITSSTCEKVWDFDPISGNLDYGHIWGDNINIGFFRVSNIYPEYLWVYNR